MRIEDHKLKVLCLNLTAQFAEDGPFDLVGAIIIDEVLVVCSQGPIFREKVLHDAYVILYYDVVVFHFSFQFSFWYSSIDISKFD